MRLLGSKYAKKHLWSRAAAPDHIWTLLETSQRSPDSLDGFGGHFEAGEKEEGRKGTGRKGTGRKRREGREGNARRW